ncbi:MAG: hypothetical protein JWO86_8032 [Myxococcaceae bacterium]|nr:hypothetical protein [Myxococcaceae bacterium]
MSRLRSSVVRSLAAAAGLALAAGCAAPGGDDAASGDENDLTSLTARQRLLHFEGVVYVEPGTSDDDVLAATRTQTQTAFGALLASKVSVRTREVQNVNPSSFVKRDVLVVDTDAPAGTAPMPMLEVSYAYQDEAIIPVELARHSSLSLALLAQGPDFAWQKIVPDCTKNDKEARDDAAGGLLWYDFDPTRSTCRKAIDREQRTIDADTAKLTDKTKMVAKSRATRLFLPTAFKLDRAATADKATYPEYDKLFGGGIDPNVLTVALVVGRLSHEHVEAAKDDGYYEWMDTLGVIFAKHPEFRLTKIEPAETLTSALVAGHEIKDLSFADFVQWTVYDTGYPAGLSAAEKKELRSKIANKLDNHWVTFEKKVKLAANDGPPKDFTLRIETLFGADEDPEPHRHAVKRGDVVVYNGHSYIGYGPLDPDNFTAESFPSTYQLFFFDSCVSYNYYEKDFFTLKRGGSKVLDIITNGIEAPEYQSGAMQGQLISRLLDGSMPSYQTLLLSAAATDSLRVVDGELDNTYQPARVKLRVTPP